MIHIGVIGQYVNRQDFILVAGLRIHTRHRRIIGAGNHNGCRRLEGFSLLVRHHITHVYCRAFTIGQTVEITTRRKL